MRSGKYFIIAILAIMFLGMAGEAKAQKVAFISSDVIRENLPDAKAAEQRLQSIVEEWKREMEVLEQNIQNLEFEINKNRLIWSDEERVTNEDKLEKMKMERLNFAKVKFSEGGEYDQMVALIMKPVEEKIYASVQKVAAEEGYDIIWDKSVMPLPYVNFKYDLTVKVLRNLDVDVDELEKELEKRIKADPRNAQKKTKKPPSSRSRSRRRSSIEEKRQEAEQEQVEQAPEEMEEPSLEKKLEENEAEPKTQEF
jgi:outer membrane protein